MCRDRLGNQPPGTKQCVAILYMRIYIVIFNRKNESSLQQQLITCLLLYKNSHLQRRAFRRHRRKTNDVAEVNCHAIETFSLYFVALF